MSDISVGDYVLLANCKTSQIYKVTAVGSGMVTASPAYTYSSFKAVKSGRPTRGGPARFSKLSASDILEISRRLDAEIQKFHEAKENLSRLGGQILVPNTKVAGSIGSLEVDPDIQ